MGFSNKIVLLNHHLILRSWYYQLVKWSLAFVFSSQKTFLDNAEMSPSLFSRQVRKFLNAYVNRLDQVSQSDPFIFLSSFNFSDFINSTFWARNQSFVKLKVVVLFAREKFRRTKQFLMSDRQTRGNEYYMHRKDLSKRFVQLFKIQFDVSSNLRL